MLTEDTKDRVQEAVERGLGPGYDKPVVWVPVEHPDFDEKSIVPAVRWRYQDEDPPDPPYTLITFGIPNPEIDEPQGVSDLGKGRVLRTGPAPDDVDADIKVTRGRPVYDEVQLTVTAEGGIDMDGVPEDEDRLTANARANAVCRAARKYLLERFNSRPLDAFDRHGNLVDVDEQIYGEDFWPELQCTPIAGRGVQKTPESMSETDSQYTSGVEMHYFELSESYEFTPVSAGISTQLETS